MDGVKLILNPDKIEFIIIGDKHTRESLIPKFSVAFFQSYVSPSVEIKKNKFQFRLRKDILQ